VFTDTIGLTALATTRVLHEPFNLAWSCAHVVPRSSKRPVPARFIALRLCRLRARAKRPMSTDLFILRARFRQPRRPTVRHDRHTSTIDGMLEGILFHDSAGIIAALIAVTCTSSQNREVQTEIQPTPAFIQQDRPAQPSREMQSARAARTRSQDEQIRALLTSLVSRDVNRRPAANRGPAPRPPAERPGPEASDAARRTQAPPPALSIPPTPTREERQSASSPAHPDRPLAV